MAPGLQAATLVFFAASMTASAIAHSCNITREQRWGDLYNAGNPKWSTTSMPSMWVWPVNYTATPNFATDAVRAGLGVCTTQQVNLRS